ncbi:hypothetical protein ACQUFY_26965 (plasmid) [Robbsia andropogonis]|uniref:hypothetical protein n=1 Tax=Robbsia andropogonis TaxID=28092 RepID=UPI003D2589D5
MPLRNPLPYGRARTPAADAFVASILLYIRRTAMIFFLLPAAMPVGALVAAGHFSFQGMAQTLLTAMANSGTDPNAIRVRDCPPPPAADGPVRNRCEHALMKDVPIAALAEESGGEIKVFYEMVVLISMGLYFCFASPSPFDARGRCGAWLSHKIADLNR